MLQIVLEKILERPLDSKEIKSVNPEGNQHWVFTGGTNAEAPVVWPPDVKSRLIGKYLDAQKDCWQEEKGNREWGDWMASWTQWTWVWANSRKPGVLPSKESQRVRHTLVTEEQQQQYLKCILYVTSMCVFLSKKKKIECLYRQNKVLVTQSCLTLCNPKDYSPPGSSVHGDSPGNNTGVGRHSIFQGIFLTQGLNPASHIAGGFFIVCATREVQTKYMYRPNIACELLFVIFPLRCIG